MKKYMILIALIVLPNLAFSRYISGEVTYNPANVAKVIREIRKDNNITKFECKNPNAPDADKIYVIHYISKRR